MKQACVWCGSEWLWWGVDFVVRARLCAGVGLVPNTARRTPNARVCRSILTVISYGNNGTIHGVQFVALFGLVDDPHHDWHITRESLEYFLMSVRDYIMINIAYCTCTLRTRGMFLVTTVYTYMYKNIIVEFGSSGGMPWLASVPCLNINPLGLLLKIMMPRT